MPQFSAASVGAPAIDTGGWDRAPVPYWSAVEDSWRYHMEVTNVAARRSQYEFELTQRNQAIRRATGLNLMPPPGPEIYMTGTSPVGADMMGREAAGLDSDDYEAKVAELRQKHPSLAPILPSREEIKARLGQHLNEVARTGQQAEQDHWTAGLIGGGGAMPFDPVQGPAMALGGPALGSVRNLALRSVLAGVVFGGATAAEAPARADEAKQYGGPAYTAEEARQDIIGAALITAGGELGLGLVGRGLIAAAPSVSDLWRQARGRLTRPGAPAEERGLANAAELEAMSEQAVGVNRNGGDFELGQQALDRGDPPPQIEPERDLGDLFGGADAPALRSVNVGGRGDLPSGALAQSEYRGRPITLARLNASDLETDAATYQYKSGGDTEGVTDRLRGVDVWNPLASNKMIVHERMDGHLYVGDGHQRMGLARRNLAKGFDAPIDAYVLREADGWTTRDVRTLAALSNIAQGSGTAMDAAKIFREAPNVLHDDSLPVTGEVITQGKGLAKLSPEAFGAAANGVIPENQAALIGQLAGDRPDLHAGLVRLLHEAEATSADEAAGIINEAKMDDWLKDQPETADLFGGLPPQSTLIARGKLKAGIARELRKDARAFSSLLKNSSAVEAAGNVIARTSSEAELGLNNAALEVISRMALRKGELGDAMAAAAGRIARGEVKVSDAAKVMATKVKAEIAKGVRLEELRGEAIDPPPQTDAQVKAAEPFSEPGGQGQAAQIAPKPEDAEDPSALPAVLFGDIAQDAKRDPHAEAHQALSACAPGI